MSGKKLMFIDPVASRVLAVDATVGVTLNVADADSDQGDTQYIAFSTDQPPSVAQVQPRAQVIDDRAVTNLVVAGKPPTDYNALLVSAWDASVEDADHYTILYSCVYPDYLGSWSATCAEPYGTGEGTAPGSTITLRAQVLDDAGEPVSQYRLFFSGSPNLPTWMTDKDGKTLPIDGNRAYIDTDASGVAVIKVANTASTIVNFNVLYQGADSISQYLVFTYLGTPALQPSLQAPELPDDSSPFDLDQYDGDNIYVSIPPDARLENAQRLAFWMNGEIVKVLTVIKGVIPPVALAKTYFKTQNARNEMGYLAQDRAGNLLGESQIIRFSATGTIPWAIPTVKGDLAKPRLQSPGQVVNISEILNGLNLVVPPYKGIKAGDLVTMTIYLNGYYPGTRGRKVRQYHSSHTVEGDDTTDGFIVAFSEAQLLNFGPSPNAQDDPPKFYAQYTVTPADVNSPPRLSDWLVLDLDTVPPEQVPG